jgi:hypothetical protein
MDARGCCTAGCLFVVLLVTGCGSHEAAGQKSPAEIQEAAEEQLLSNLGQALPELIRRLRAAVSTRDGLVIVQSPLSLETAILPASAPWVLVCGAGIGVHFGSVVAEHDGSVAIADVLNVPLALPTRVLTKEECAQFAPAIGKEIQDIIKSR